MHRAVGAEAHGMGASTRRRQAKAAVCSYRLGRTSKRVSVCSCRKAGTVSCPVLHRAADKFPLRGDDNGLTSGGTDARAALYSSTAREYRAGGSTLRRLPRLATVGGRRLQDLS